MTRPTVDLLLPSGVKVVLNAYLTISESRQIKKLTYQSMKVSVNTSELPATEKPSNSIKIDKFDASFQLEAQDLAFKFLIVEAYDTDGAKVVNPFEFVTQLPSSDGDVLFDKVDELTSGSSLTTAAKKN